MSDTKSILLSGGARGIGRCLARHFLARGHKVFILDIDEPELKHTVEVHLKQYHPNVSYKICDLTKVDDIRSSVKQAAEFLGNRIDVVINNGGIATPTWKDGATMEDPATMDQFQMYLDTNLRAPFAVVQASIPYMKTAGGKSGKETRKDYEAQKAERGLTSTAGPCIINVSSFRSQMSDPNQEGYAASKAGQNGLTHSMAVSCSQWGIRVNSISPGRIKVMAESKEADESGQGLEFDDKDYEQHATNRAGKPEDIAEAAEYLIGAGFVTGQDITVDGGAVIQK
ncbi:hypothetical protein BAUCODRAFT_381035 [Baudoinia panamericana UAMH 10762]|uniref:Uncharacterized protein n=1 Tax=Baudoinia panamericana (strain UAMH 10762) TaxID=717646 RepID=M2LVW8_BAUPA|nr:uncharacterized protein BAUCODRAFT_381035 [Baudoinia panamericana UAMH 10762]EMC98817.1 hypothetical protein BAUCODRAFT_381035 [Baudoinia panamericana UAMH 10762]